MGWVVNVKPRPLYPPERPGTHCTGSWVGPRAVLEGCGKSRHPPGFDPRTVQTVAQSLYRMSYPANQSDKVTTNKCGSRKIYGALGNRIDWTLFGLTSRCGDKFFCSSKCADLIWGPPSPPITKKNPII